MRPPQKPKRALSPQEADSLTQPTLSLPDHDMLIRIDTKLDVFKQGLDSLTAQQATDTSKLEGQQAATAARLDARVTVIERALDRQAGFISGGKALWAILGALPPGIAALIFRLSR